MKRIATWLRYLAECLDPSVFPVASEPEPLKVRACELVAWADSAFVGDGRGEWKRHQVLARLQKEFPDSPARVISQAIEDAL